MTCDELITETLACSDTVKFQRRMRWDLLFYDHFICQ